MATYELTAGIWRVTCPRHGFVGASIEMAPELAHNLTHDHNRWCLP